MKLNITAKIAQIFGGVSTVCPLKKGLSTC